jgi:pimeloyl-ACP methyl ester carboxylesterase
MHHIHGLVVVVTLLLVVASVGAAPVTYAREATPARASTGALATGDFAGLVDIGGGREMSLTCRGEGSPTVILEAGFRNTGQIWQVTDPAGATAVLAGISGFTRVCAYDRPGTILDASHFSRSDPVPMPRTADAVVTDLHALLQAAGVPGPYVLVAHSLGGVFARLYASTYPDEVVGMVLVDAWSEQLPALLGPRQWEAYATLAAPAPPGLETYADLEQIDFAAASSAVHDAATASPLRPMPLVVISRGKPVALPPNVPDAFSPEAFERAWTEGQSLLAGLLPDARHVTAAASTHYVQIEQPQLVIDVVRAVVDAVREPSTWETQAATPSAE